MIIKVCGMRRSENIVDVEKLGIDLMGFIFYAKSPRYVSEVPEYMPKTAKKVGVFVNETIETVLKISKDYSLDFLQLHGSETVEYCEKLKSLGHNLIKAFSISSAEDVQKAKDYDKCCEMFIFDTKCSSVGGSGVSFDWSLLENYTGNTPFLLSGGLGLNNIDSIAQFKHPQLAGYDLNSTFEVSPAEKDVAKIYEFIKKLKYDE
ncbi:MAG: phosphoribosylanthranilate isomerase [Rikenellaceae bacterium]